MLLTWHCVHGIVAWNPVSAKPVDVWLNVAVVQFAGAVPWQVVQSVGNPVCGGLLAPVKSAWWHEMQVVFAVVRL